MAALAQPVPQEATIREIVDSVPPPKGVRFQRLVFDNDHSGDPAVYIFFSVSKEVPLTKAIFKVWRDFKREVTDPIWKIPSGPIPYVRFKEVR